VPWSYDLRPQRLLWPTGMAVRAAVAAGPGLVASRPTTTVTGLVAFTLRWTRAAEGRDMLQTQASAY
jgi:hypothetical protein